MIVKIVI